MPSSWREAWAQHLANEETDSGQGESWDFRTGYRDGLRMAERICTQMGAFGARAKIRARIIDTFRAGDDDAE